jgi:hypothetical protein
MRLSDLSLIRVIHREENQVSSNIFYVLNDKK